MQVINKVIGVLTMKEYEIRVVKYGTINVNANSEEEALKLVKDLDEDEFYWGEWCNEEIVAIYED